MQDNENKKRIGSLLKIVTTITISIGVITFAYFSDEQNRKNDPELKIQHFQKNRDFICQLSLGGRTAIIVNKKSGYKLYKEKYFKSFFTSLPKVLISISVNLLFIFCKRVSYFSLSSCASTI